MFLIPALLGLVAQVVPGLIGLLAGPKAADVAGQVVSIAQTVTGTSSQEEAHTALSADPAKLAEVQTQLAQVALEHLQAQNEDRNSARQREITLKDHTPAVLAASVTLGFFGLLAVMAFKVLPDANVQVLNILLGSLGSGWMMILSYYFGASAPAQAAHSGPLGH